MLLALLPILLGQALPARSAIAQEVGERFRDCPTCPEMVVVPAGTFIMGSPESANERGRLLVDENGDVAYKTAEELTLEFIRSVEETLGKALRVIEPEGPQRYVTFASPFAIGVAEITFAEWDACARVGGCGGLIPDNEGWGGGSRPVINITWEDAESYTEWLSDLTGEQYSLLSEAQWEYAARAGTETARYWGHGHADQCRYANGSDRSIIPKHPIFEDGSAACSDGYPETAPVRSFEPNAFGLHDMLGNVAEWTQDCWNDRYSGAPVDGTAWKSGDCSRRVARGGAWYSDTGSLRAADRFWPEPVDLRDSGVGFRIARAVVGGS